MVALIGVVPGYIFIAAWAAGRPQHVLALAADARVPLAPVWGLAYGALYLFLILLPVLVVREEPHIRRMFLAYLFVWLTSYGVFFAYPTVAPRPAHVAAPGFAGWGLRLLYSADPPYNCFPSLHVAHSFVSAFACRSVHRGVGRIAMLCACLVALSTLLTRQHYLLDVVAGIGLACVGQLMFFRSQDPVPPLERQAAPAMTMAVSALVGVMVGGAWIGYHWFGS